MGGWVLPGYVYPEKMENVAESAVVAVTVKIRFVFGISVASPS